MPETGKLINRRYLFVPVLKAEIPNQDASMVGSGPLSGFLVVSSHIARGWGALRSLFDKGTGLLHEGSILKALGAASRRSHPLISSH